MTDSTDRQALAISAFVGGLADSGVEFAVISPGSRSAPLTLALALSERITCVPAIDERVAGFVALGAAKATGRPSVVVTTSGTAAANLSPAVHEAREARVPLIALTADRPPELRGVGEGQTIDQTNLFGTAAIFSELDGTGDPDAWHAAACDAVAGALGQRPGPVQINFALRPPLDTVAPPAEARPVRAPGATARTADTGIQRMLSGARRPLAIAGRDERRDAARFGEECSRLGIPVLADPLSDSFRSGSSVRHWDPLLRTEPFNEGLEPDFVLRSGDLPTSKPLREWLGRISRSGVPVIQFDPELSGRDPFRSSSVVSTSDAVETLAGVAELAVDDAWVIGLIAAGQAAHEAIAAANTAFSEPSIASMLSADRSYGEILVSSASMPIRDLESFGELGPGSPRILSNRGANGIDGVISTAAGAALASGERTTVLIGDVAFVHDQGALAFLRDSQAPVTLVLVDNGGGAIFDALPVAGRGDSTFESFFTTPTNLDTPGICAAWSIPCSSVGGLEQLREALASASALTGPCVVHAPLDRRGGHETRRRLSDAVSAARRA